MTLASPEPKRRWIQGGPVSQLWSDILEPLDLDLTAQPRMPGTEKAP